MNNLEIEKTLKSMYGSDIYVSFPGINTVCIVSGKLVIHMKVSDFTI